MSTKEVRKDSVLQKFDEDRFPDFCANKLPGCQSPFPHGCCAPGTSDNAGLCGLHEGSCSSDDECNEGLECVVDGCVGATRGTASCCLPMMGKTGEIE